MSFLYALRLGRWGAFGFGALAFVITLAQASGFYAIAGHTAAERAAFARSMAQIATEFSVILPPPLRADTVGGYVQWRAYGALSIIVAIWALASAGGATRGDEEKGLVEAVLTTGIARADALFWRFAGFAAYAIVFSAGAALGYLAGVAAAHDQIDAGGVAGASLELVALAVACHALVVLVCQLTAARIATACAGALLLALFLLNSMARTLDVLAPWTWLSPFHQYDASRPLAPGGALDVRATEALFGIAVVAGLLAALAFAYRDIGSPLWRPPVRVRSTARTYKATPLWRIPVLRSLYDRRVGLVAWAAGVAALGVVFVELTRQMVKPLLELPGLQVYFNAIIHGDVYPSFLGYIWFGFAQLLIAGFAIAQVVRWSAEDVDGRLELALANPVSRTSLVVERAVVLVIGALIVVVPAGFAVAAEARHEALTLSTGNLVAATLLLVPFATFFAAVGSLLAAWLPRAAVGVLGGLAFASYLLTQVGPLFRWPTWTLDLSPFHLYGEPLIDGVDRTGLGVMLAVSLVGFVASALLLKRRDVGR
jgi:ABC-2 type transport system permease protein